jgi:hypothetical protein
MPGMGSRNVDVLRCVERRTRQPESPPMADAKHGKEGTSFPFKPDLRTKTARPTSVGPHHVTRDQEDPANPGIEPEKGYAAEIARNNAAAAERPAGNAAVVAPAPKTVEKPGKATTKRR